MARLGEEGDRRRAVRFGSATEQHFPKMLSPLGIHEDFRFDMMVLLRRFSPEREKRSTDVLVDAAAETPEVPSFPQPFTEEPLRASWAQIARKYFFAEQMLEEGLLPGLEPQNLLRVLNCAREMVHVTERCIACFFHAVPKTEEHDALLALVTLCRQLLRECKDEVVVSLTELLKGRRTYRAAERIMPAPESRRCPDLTAVQRERARVKEEENRFGRGAECWYGGPVLPTLRVYREFLPGQKQWTRFPEWDSSDSDTSSGSDTSTDSYKSSEGKEQTWMRAKPKFKPSPQRSQRHRHGYYQWKLSTSWAKIASTCFSMERLQDRTTEEGNTPGNLAQLQDRTLEEGNTPGNLAQLQDQLHSVRVARCVADYIEHCVTRFFCATGKKAEDEDVLQMIALCRQEMDKCRDEMVTYQSLFTGR